MDIAKMIAELHEERDGVNQAIEVLQRIAASRGRRRGRPPDWMKDLKGIRRLGRPPGSKNKPKPND